MSIVHLQHRKAVRSCRMCGRYSPKILALEGFLESLAFPPLPGLADSYNIAPTQLVPIGRQIDGQRSVSAVRWGLIPYFTRGEPPKFSTINARIESVATPPPIADPGSGATPAKGWGTK